MNMRRYDFVKQILLCSILLLQFSMQVWGQNCDVANTCTFFGYPQHTIIGHPDSSLTRHLSLTCSGNFFYNQISSIRWLFAKDRSVPKLLSVVEDPNLTARGSSLELRNVTKDYEGTYYCQAEYVDGDLSTPEGIGCVFVAGHAFYKSCPDTDMRIQNCATVTVLQAEIGGSVEFDTRVGFRHGGSCGFKQNVRFMHLDKVDENGHLIDTWFICQNLGHFSNRSCTGNLNVSVSFHGDHKYDIKLRLNDLKEADAGNYRVRVYLDNEGGRRTSIYKNFSVALTAIADDTPDGGCPLSPKGSDPLLMLNGEVVSPNSTITFAQIMEGKQSLLCVTTDDECCNGSGNSTAQFLSPSNVPVTETPGSGLYVSKGKQIIRLNRQHGPAWTEEGRYCCSVHGREDGSAGTATCVKIITCSCHGNGTN